MKRREEEGIHLMAEKLSPIQQLNRDYESIREEFKCQRIEREREQAPLREMMHKVIAIGFRKLAKKAPDDPVFIRRLKRARDCLKIGV